MKLFLILIGIFVLRIPSLFEPNWYGDEGIYLMIGQALNGGAVLYRDIWDNKPPLLYALYAIVPTLLWAKAMATVFVLGTCVSMYALAKRLLQQSLQGESLNRALQGREFFALLASLLTGIFLSIPLLEGTIANAELFFTLPIVWGAVIIFNFKFEIFNQFKIFNLKLLIVGFLMAVAFLIKVPAVFDFLGMAVFLLIVRKNLKDFIPIIAGFGVPMVLVFVYFYFNNALPDFIAAAFSQNASYVAVSSGTFSTLTNPLFVKGLVLIVALVALAIGFFKKIVSKELLFLGLWFGFSLFGALISNRPYMHYLLQVVPPVILLMNYLVKNFRKYFWVLGSVIAIVFLVMNQFKSAFHLHTVAYYKNFYDFASERKLWLDYAGFFDKRIPDTYKIADYIRNNTNSKDTIFIWDDAANVYYLSERMPATKFIQAHHLTTVDRLNYDLVIDELKVKKPRLILIKKNSRFKFPKLLEFAKLKYEGIGVVGDLKIFKLKIT